MAKQALRLLCGICGPECFPVGSKPRRRTFSRKSWRCVGAVVRSKLWVGAALIALAGCKQQDQQGAAPTGTAAQPDAQADLRAAATDPRLAHFYEGRGWRAAWTPAAEAELGRAIGAAGAQRLRKGGVLRPIRPRA